MNHRTSAALWLLAGALAAPLGCSSSERKADSPSAAGAYAPEDAAQTQAPAYAQPGYPSPAPSQPGPDYATPPTTATAALDDAERSLDRAILGQDAAGQPLAAGLDRCTTVCDALASMRRAAEHVCELDSSRCDDAKSRVERAQTRAQSACPACGAPT